MEETAASVTANLHAIQQAFQLIAMLQLTAYMWPPQAPVKDEDAFDFVIVGAGSAGCVVAARLAEAGYNVSLLEAGGDPPLESVIPTLFTYLEHTKEDWNFTAPVKDQCHKDHTVDIFAGKMLGGSNGHNALIYVRGNPYDYQLWTEAVNDTEWSYDEVLPFFKKSENLKSPEILKSPTGIYHGTDGPLEVVSKSGTAVLNGFFDAVAEIGNKITQDYNGYETLGFGNIMYTSTLKDGPRQSTAYAYLTPMKDNPNLHVMKNTLATRVIFDECKNAVAVEVITENKKTVNIKARKEIILSAGTINSPKLLMLSGIGQKDHLSSKGVEVIADLPVGKNLCDQPGVMLQYLMEESDAPPPPPKNPFLTNPQNTFVGFAAVNKSQTYPDYESLNFVYPHDSTSTMATCASYGFHDYICQQFYDAAKGRNVLFTTLNLLTPSSRGEVLLKSKNPYDKPLINMNYFGDKTDVERLVDSIEDFIRLSDTKYFRSKNASLLYIDLPACRDFEYGSRDYWGCYAQCATLTTYHYAGTCPMGAVVDSKLRVYNVNRLRVADASVMPTPPSGNTNGPTIMIGEKAAAMIINEHK